MPKFLLWFFLKTHLLCFRMWSVLSNHFPSDRDVVILSMYGISVWFIDAMDHGCISKKILFLFIHREFDKNGEKASRICNIFGEPEI